jgi:phytoene synthase
VSISAQTRAILGRRSKSFALASRLLPAAMRDDAALLYAYCRRADDAVDGVELPEARRRLGALFEELRSIYAWEPQAEPLAAAFQELVRRRGIAEEHPRDLLLGMQSDLGAVRMQTLDDLLLYAYRVAGVVGSMMCTLLDVRDRRATKNAVHLGIAMQLTNICRDVREDLELGRVYLPAELLVASGATGFGEERALTAEYARPLARAVERLLSLADRYYRSADRGIAALPFRAALAVRTARRVYAEIGAEITRRDYRVLEGRAVVSPLRKLYLALRAAGHEAVARCARFFTRTSPLDAPERLPPPSGEPC